MANKSRVPVYKQESRSVQVEDGATVGAQIGRDLYDTDGTVVTWSTILARVAQGAASVPQLMWNSIIGIPANIKALAGIATTGFYVITGAGTSATRTLTVSVGELSGSNLDGVAGNPVLGLADVALSAGGSLVALTRDGKGRITHTRAASQADIDAALGYAAVQSLVSGDASITIDDTDPRNPIIYVDVAGADVTVDDTTWAWLTGDDVQEALDSADDLFAAIDTALAGKQPLDATLTALAAQNWAANAIPIGTGADTLTQTAFAANTFPARGSTGNLVAKSVTDNALLLLADATVPRVVTTNTWNFAQTFQAGATFGSSVSTNTDLLINRAAGAAGSLRFYTAGVIRWTAQVSAGAESGANAGSDFAIYNYSDGGVLIGTPFAIGRATGIVNFNTAPTVNAVTMPLKSTANVWTGGQTFSNTTTTFGDAAGLAGNVFFKRAAGAPFNVLFQSGSLNRWVIQISSTAESGADVGSDFALLRYNDAGASLGSVMTVQRSTGLTSFIAPVTVSTNGLSLIGNRTLASGTNGFAWTQTIQSDNTTGFNAFISAPNPLTQAAVFTLPFIYHFRANNAVLGAGSTLTNQYGFRAANLTAGTNNYAFIGEVNSTASGQWNCYMSGLAPNHFAGEVRIGSTTDLGAYILQVTGDSYFTGNLVVGNATTTKSVVTDGAASGTGGGSFFSARAGGGPTIAFGNMSALHGGAYDGTGTIYSQGTLNFTPGGSTVRATLDSNGNFRATATLQPGTYTVATLPAVGLVAGMRATVTDANAPAWGVAVAGGGAVTVPVFYNGAAWIVG